MSNIYWQTNATIKVDELNTTFNYYQTTSKTSPSSPLFLFLHGAGHTAMSWSFVSKFINEKSNNSYNMIAYDYRGHGTTSCHNGDENLLSLEQLSLDCVLFMKQLYPNDDNLPKQIVLVGHSLGGAVVVDIAKKRLLKNVVAVAVLDVVEGTALESLKHMHGFLLSRPDKFKSIDAAIDWSVKHGGVRNVEAARISIPFQLVEQTDAGQVYYTWRTNLNSTRDYWKGWFQELSSKFLTMPAGKMLLLAGTDRLDSDLTVGQMQGKYQLVLFNDVGTGHNIHEDSPEKVADSLITFLQRNQPIEIKRFPIPGKPKNYATKPSPT